MAKEFTTVHHVMGELAELDRLHTVREEAHSEAATGAAKRRPAPPVPASEEASGER